MNPPNETTALGILVAARRCIDGKDPGRPFNYVKRAKEACADNETKTLMYRLSWDDTRVQIQGDKGRAISPKGLVALYITSTPYGAIPDGWDVVLKKHFESFGAKVIEHRTNGSAMVRFRPPTWKVIQEKLDERRRNQLSAVKVVDLPGDTTTEPPGEPKESPVSHRRRTLRLPAG